MNNFDAIMARAEERAKEMQPQKRRINGTPEAIQKAVTDGVPIDDHVKILQHVLRGRGFRSSGFDSMTDEEVGEVLRTSQTVKWQTRRMKRGKKGGGSNGS